MRKRDRRAQLPRAAPATYERQLAVAGHRLVAGVDEAGCGALAGPVVAAAVILPPELRIAHVTDSKRLPPHTRHELYGRIRQAATCWSVALCPPELIDRLNIYHARLFAMRQAVEQLLPPPDYVLVDGRVTPGLTMPCEAIVGGDGICRVISAASIIAKVTRDAIMDQLDAIYPAYGFANHKGYGTARHLEALTVDGPCPVHRRTFNPIASSMQQVLDYECP